MIEAKKHVFLLLKDIEIPTDEGNVRGDTILDSTWNLPANRFGYLPRNFCKSYEEIRKQDIDRDGKDNESHKIDEKLSNITLNLDIKYEGEAMKSLGIVDEQGRFPLKWLLERLKDIKEGEFTQQQKLQKIFEEVEKYCPEFAKCQNETTQMLELLINGVVEIEFNRCIVNRVYAKNDEEKIPILFVYIDLPGEGRKFYIADKESGKFVEREQREFENEYDCYNTDKQKNNGHRFWENDIQDEKELKDGNSQNEEQR